MLRLCSHNRSNSTRNSDSSLYTTSGSSPESERLPSLSCQNGAVDSSEELPRDDNKIRKYNLYKYMNARAVGNNAYVPTDFENISNIVTHGVWVIPSVAGTLFLLHLSKSKDQYIAALVYGFSLIGLFTISTTYHSLCYIGKFRLLKEVLHVCDRAIIYIFIAASYTPWLLLKDLKPGLGSQLCWLIWSLAILGIVYQYYFHERYKHLETVFYLCLGVTPSFAIFNMQENRGGLSELILGGVIYIIGIVFFKLDGFLPLSHSFWHIFVNFGATCHYYAVCKYLMLESDNQPTIDGFKSIILPTEKGELHPLGQEEAAL